MSYANGQAPEDALVYYRGLKASPDMARRVKTAERLYMERNPGGWINPNEIYRDLAGQKYWREYWCGQGLCGNAAEPGQSNHGDWEVGAVDWNADDIALRDEVAALVGLTRTIASETWHYAVRWDPRIPLDELDGSPAHAPDRTKGNLMLVQNIRPFRGQPSANVLVRETGDDRVVNHDEAAILGTLYTGQNADELPVVDEGVYDAGRNARGVQVIGG